MRDETFGSKYSRNCRPGSTRTCWELTFEGWILAGREQLRSDGEKKDGEREGVRHEVEGGVKLLQEGER